MDNPFERYDLDPLDGIAAITQRLKELAEDATDEAERDRIRAAWEELTLHPARRLRAALFAHPETRKPLGSPPSLPRAARAGAVRLELGLRDLAARPSVLVALRAASAVDAGDAGDAGGGESDDLPPPLDDDPLL